MIIERIAIKSWRGYREPHTFRFKSGINLLAGRNEAGKSTLFEALTRVLFDRHNSKTEEIRAIQPVGSSLGPEACVQFQAAGQRYRAVKRFLQDPKSEVYSERGGRWELDHEGDLADAQLREILRGEATTRTAARPEHRGLAQALWYLQSDGAIPEKKWNDGVKEGLQGLMQLVARSPFETAVLERISSSHGEYWTPTGRVATKSELGRLQSELPELEGHRTGLLEKNKTLESHRADLEEIQSTEAEKRAELEKARADVTALSVRVEQAEEFEREREAKERAKNEAMQRAQRLQEHSSLIRDKQEKIRTLRKEAKQLEDLLSDSAVDIKAEESARERHARRWKEELEPKLKILEGELQALRALERLRKLEKDRTRLEQHLGKAMEKERALEARKKERAGLVAPSEREWKRFVSASKKLSVLQAQVEASSVRVVFEWTGKAYEVRTRPSIQASEDNEYLVAEPTEFEVEGVGTVHVRSGASALKDLLTERDKVQREVAGFLMRFAAADADEMAALREKGRDLDTAISALEDGLAEILEAEPGAEEELARIVRGIEEETRAAGTLPSDAEKKGGQWIRDQIIAKDREKKRLVAEIAEEQKAEQATTKKHLELVETREATSNGLAEHRAEIRTHEESITATLETYGTVEQLEKLALATEAEVRKSADALALFQLEYEEKVVTPRRLHKHSQDRARELEQQLGELRTKIAATLARIEEFAAQGNYGLLADVEIEIARKKRRLEVLTRRADGARLLHDLVLASEKQRSAVLSGPIKALVNRWLGILTEETYDALQIDHDLKPMGVHMTRYGAHLPLTSLSHGAQEQAVVLLRLGMAVLVSDAERNLVVIDDRLVNADPVRMRRLCLILQEAAEACQIVIATCNDTPYAGMGAHTVRVPADGRSTEAGAG